MELNDKWIIWSHGLNNTDWNIDSYNKLFELFFFMSNPKNKLK